MARSRPVLIPVQAHHVLPEFLECLVKGLFVIFALSLAIADEAASVADKNEDTPMVDAIK